MAISRPGLAYPVKVNFLDGPTGITFAFCLTSPMEIKTDHRTVRLISGDREQSVWRKDQPDYIVHSYAQLIALALLTWRGYTLKRRGRALIIGLGGGIMCRFMLKHFPNVAIDVAEPDAAVIEYARRYFDLDRRVAVHCIDGRSHMSGRTGKYDIVVLDAFDSTYVPADLMTAEFLQLAKKRLQPEGILISNTWVLPDITPHEEATYTSVFGPVWDFRRMPNTDGNRIILVNDAAAARTDQLLEILAERATYIDLQSGHPQVRIPPARRMVSYEEMVRRLHIMQVVAPMSGKIFTDANIGPIRAKASFDN